MKNIKQILFLALMLMSILLLCPSDTPSHEEGTAEIPSDTPSCEVGTAEIPSDTPTCEEITVEMLLGGEYVTVTAYRYPLMPERYEELYGMPEEILSASTPELLEAVLQSQYMKECIDAPMLSFDINYSYHPPRDLYLHKGFVELSSRADFLQALDEFAEHILTGTEDVDDRMIKGFILLLSSEDVGVLADASPYGSDGFPYLQTMYNFLETAPSLSDALFTFDDYRDFYHYGICNLCENLKNATATMTRVTCPGPPCSDRYSPTATEFDLTDKNKDMDTEVKERSIEQYWMP